MLQLLGKRMLGNISAQRVQCMVVQDLRLNASDCLCRQDNCCKQGMRSGQPGRLSLGMTGSG